MGNVLAVILLIVSISVHAADYTVTMPLDLTFSAYLDQPVSNDSKVKDTFVKGGVYRVFNLFCEKSIQHCNVWVHDMADEYCNSKTSGSTLKTAGFDFNNWDDVPLRQVGSEFYFEVQDNILYGPTQNAIKIALSPRPNTYGLETMVAKVTGVASALSTTQGVPLQSQYRQLEGKVVCNFSLFPPGQ